MTKVAIHIPETVLYREEREVSPSEMNHGSHLGFEKAVALVAEARVRCFRHLGLQDVGADGIGVIVADLAVRYRMEIRGGDRLIIEVSAGNPGDKRCDVFYRFLKADSGRSAIEAKTGIAFFDYGARRVVSMPEPFRRGLFGESGTTLPPETFGGAARG